MMNTCTKLAGAEWKVPSTPQSRPVLSLSRPSLVTNILSASGSFCPKLAHVSWRRKGSSERTIRAYWVSVLLSRGKTAHRKVKYPRCRATFSDLSPQLLSELLVSWARHEGEGASGAERWIRASRLPDPWEHPMHDRVEQPCVRNESEQIMQTEYKPKKVTHTSFEWSGGRCPLWSSYRVTCPFSRLALPLHPPLLHLWKRTHSI